MRYESRRYSRRNWIRRSLIATYFIVLAAICAWLLLGCERRARSEIVYVPDTDLVLFVAPGDRLIAADGNEATIPYKGLILSNERYVEILKDEK